LTHKGLATRISEALFIQLAIERRVFQVKIQETMDGNVAVLTLKGKMMGGPDMQDLHDHIKGLMGDGVSQVVADLGKVKWLNSSGLGALMGALTTLRNEGGDLKLAHTSDKIQSLLMITKLMSIFETYDDVESAIKAFGE
jgi:anti-sigma B factor antagonist